jgi:uncharacterized protein YbjT (DUF2867 family)
VILVTTAGKVGSEAVRLLRERDVPASIDDAMAGVSAVVLVSPAAPAQELNVVHSAARAGVGHVVKATSKASADGKTYWLTGPELISNYDVAAVLSELLGRTITYRELTFEENKDAMIRAGVPGQIAEMNAQAFSLTADGDAEWVTEDVPSLLGRPARSFGQFAADYAAAFS